MAGNQPTIRVNINIANPEQAISQVGPLLCRGLNFEDPGLQANLLQHCLINNNVVNILGNGMQPREYKWGILFHKLLMLLPGEVETFFDIVLRVDNAFNPELKDELKQRLENPNSCNN